MTDWTCGPDGKANTSIAFRLLVEEVDSIIRNDAFGLIAGRSHNTALLIIAKLAHSYGMHPTNVTEAARDEVCEAALRWLEAQQDPDLREIERAAAGGAVIRAAARLRDEMGRTR